MHGDELKVPARRTDERDDQHNDQQHNDQHDDRRRGDDHGRREEPGDVSYRDPYGRGGGDVLVASGSGSGTGVDADTGPVTQPNPVPVTDAGPGSGRAGEHVPAHSVEQAPDHVIVTERVTEAVPGQQRPADEKPAHAAPAEFTLFDRDPAEVQARWRDLQASFVDDPGEAVRRADGLVGEVVEALTSALRSRTEELRGRWKDGDGDTGDTERLRLALREYRGVLERLLALAGSHGGQPQGQSQGRDQGQNQGQGEGPRQGSRQGEER